MPLPSSGNQIALSQIRNEFSLGSGQIAMSQLYGKGNAPSSGEIQIGADFHGVSAETILHSSTITVGQRVLKSTVKCYNRNISNCSSSCRQRINRCNYWCIFSTSH
jgi:hypothetical protein